VVLDDAVVKIPTGFTPNGDGKNDWFGPVGKVPNEYSIRIFNRNGETVFKSSSTYSKWDGRFNGTIQPNGVFIYWVQYRDIKNKLFQQKGTLALIR
jgi:gliding motility-associated-like protein